MLLAGVLTLLLGMAGIAWAQPEEGPRISMDFRDVSLKEILKAFSQQSGRNFIASQDVQDRTATLFLDAVTVDDALDNILRANRLVAEQVEGSDIFIVRPSPEEASETVTRIYRLKYARLSTSHLAVQAAAISGFQATSQGGGSSSGSRSSGGEEGAHDRGREAGSATGSTIGTGVGGIDAAVFRLLSGRGSLVVDERTNSLIVTDTPQTLRRIEAAIAQLDVATGQVMIETELLETSTNALTRLGVEFGSSDGTMLVYTGPARTTRFPLPDKLLSGATPEATLGEVSLQSLKAVLKLLKKDSDTKLLARPRILTLDGESATIDITEDTAVSQSTVSTSAGGALATTSEQIERQTTGVSLLVTPQINDGRHVTMLIHPIITETVTSPLFSTVINPSTRSAQSLVRVRDGETVVVGGLIKEEREREIRKVPFFGDVPLFGAAFRREKLDLEQRELILFLTPRILQDRPWIAAGVGPGGVAGGVAGRAGREQVEPFLLRTRDEEVNRVLDLLGAGSSAYR